MKKILAMMMALVLVMGLYAFSAAEGADISGLTVTTPGGAPALALVAMAVENPGQYTTVAADTIAAAFAGKEADFIIAPLMPGFRVQCRGAVFLRVSPCIPEQAFLGHNGNHGRSQRKYAGNVVLCTSADDILHSRYADHTAHNSQDTAQQQGCHTLVPFMAIRMLFIRFLG